MLHLGLFQTALRGVRMFGAVLLAVLGPGTLGLPPARGRQGHLREGRRVLPAPPLVTMVREAPKIAVGWYSLNSSTSRALLLYHCPQWALSSS